MKYDHMVKVNGQYYTAGTEIPDPDVCVEPAEEVEKSPEAEDSASGEEYTENPPTKRGRRPAASK